MYSAHAFILPWTRHCAERFFAAARRSCPGTGIPAGRAPAGGKGKRARGEFNHYIILLNPSPRLPASAELPPGAWALLADASGVRREGKEPAVTGIIVVPPSSGVIAGGRS